MTGKKDKQFRGWPLLLLLGLAALAFGLFAGTAQARKLGEMGSRGSQVAAPLTGSSSVGSASDRVSPRAADGFIQLVPGAAGTCAAPPNGGAVAAGCTFVLDLFVNAGTNAAPNGVTAQQSYLTFTYQTIQNGRVSTIGAGCTITSTATQDNVVFDAVLQNEICNGPNPCTIRGIQVPAGSIAYASGALNNCPEGCPDGDHPENPFRVGMIGICTTNPGLAILHWQFSPPAPPTRDTELVAYSGELVHNPALFTDYVFCVGPAGSCAATPTAGPTDTNTPVPTNTNTPLPTNTNTTIPTNTTTRTNTATITPLATHTPTRTNTATNTAVPTNTPTRTTTATNTPAAPTPTTPPGGDAFLVFTPGDPGTCPAPPNGGTVLVGCTFVLDLFLNTGSRQDATAQQSYLTFTNQLIQNARVSTIGAGCTITSTATQDNTVFDAVLQNEICNGPNPCTFRGITVGPGSIAYASGALNNCTEGCGGIFRVAQFGICATAPGQAVLHWQFSPPAPPTRDTEVVAFDGSLIHNPALFTDYIINIQGAGGTVTVTPAATNTPTAVPTNTNTSVPTNTNTSVPTNTNTAVPTNTNTAVATGTNTAVPTNTGTSVPTNTNTPVATNTNTAVRTNTSTVIPTNTNTSVPTNTNTAVPTNTNTSVPTNTNTSVPTNTGTAAATNTNTAVPTNTNTAVPTNTHTSVPTNTRTAVPTNTNTSVPTNTNTAVPTNTNTSVPTNTNTSVPTNTNTSVPTNTRTSVPTNTNTAVPTNTNTAVATSTNTTVPTNTNTSVPTNTFTAVATSTNTPTSAITNTPGAGTATRTRTITRTPSSTRTITRTRTATPIVTGTPCDVCNLYFADTNIACNPDGTVQWQAVVRNNGSCTVTTPYKVQLQVRHGYNGQFVTVEQRHYTGVFPPGDTEITNSICHQFSPADDFMRIYIALDSTTTECNADHLSPFIDVCQHPTACPPDRPFNDVPVESTFYNPVSGLVTTGAASGYGDGSFRPMNTTTRGQLAKLVVLAFNLPLATDDTQHFSDVPADHAFFAYVETAYSRGLISGYSDGTFRPFNNITRGQVAKVVVLAAGWQLANPATSTFSDVPADSTYYRYVETAYAKGIISGYGDGTFRPGNSATRGQIAQVTMLAATVQQARLPFGGHHNTQRPGR